jgi:hypothetical protein
MLSLISLLPTSIGHNSFISMSTCQRSIQLCHLQNITLASDLELLVKYFILYMSQRMILTRARTRSKITDMLRLFLANYPGKRLIE